MTSKLDLITILPGIRLETKRYRYGNYETDANLVAYLKFNDVQIMNNSYLKTHSRAIKMALRSMISEVSEKITDWRGDVLEDFVIIMQKNVSTDLLSPETTNAENLFLYLANSKYSIVGGISMEIIRIIPFANGYELYVNNHRADYGADPVNKLYVLPGVQEEFRKLSLSKKRDLILFRVLERLMKTRQGGKLAERIFSSISLFNQAVILNMRGDVGAIVLMVSALEAILALPRNSKKAIFVHSMKLLLGARKDVVGWANDLYELRSKIVHGDVVKKKELMLGRDSHVAHVSIAKEAYENCLWLIMQNHGLVALRRAFYEHEVNDLVKQIISNKKKLESLLSNRNKYTYQSFARDKKKYREFLERLEYLTFGDYSGESLVIEILGLISAVIANWIPIEVASLKSFIARQDVGNDLKKYGRYQLKLLGKLSKANKKLVGLKIQSYKQRRRVREVIMEVKECGRLMFPIVHRKEEYKFKLEEFIDRSLGALGWAYRSY